MENEVIKSIFKETYEGPEASMSWFTESEPGSGLFGTIESVTAAEASVPVNGVTIAAHTNHTRFSMQIGNQRIDGEKNDIDWADSWAVQSVTEEEWEQIQKELHKEYSVMMGHMDSKHGTEGMFINAIAHSAYHLGAIRQLVKSVKS